MQFAQIRDRIEPGAAALPLDLSAFPGLWINSNPDSNGIARLVMSESNGALTVQGFGLGLDGLIDWGPVEATVFTAGPSSRVASGFTCEWDFGFSETRLQGMLAKGLLVLAEFHSFKDSSTRADHFVREYFALTHGRY